ncbi:MAG: DmsC/YnfH family molybdoenzyme membrane anchor subunit [Pseudomonadota bacterium]
MHPAFSVIFLTTLIGVGQGLFLALYMAELGVISGWLPAQSARFYVLGSAIALAFLFAGLVASFFHLGRPERAWRAAAMWRTSWLSREVIVLPAFMVLLFVYGALHFTRGHGTVGVGAAAVIACMTLFICTGMIYACIRFLQEWATSLTLVNFTLFGAASGYTLATAYAYLEAPTLTGIYAPIAAALTLLAWCGRVASLKRNARIRPRSSLQTAIGIEHPQIAQKAQGFMGGSFNTREFFHGKTAAVVTGVKWSFLLLVFPAPTLLLVAGAYSSSITLTAAAFLAQYVGLLAERWYFFAQARHPQNLYYQTIS